MARNRFFAATAAVVILSTVATIHVSAQVAPRKTAAPAADPHHGAFAACAEACSDCQRACDSCATHCAALIVEGEREHKLTLASCQDCADVCTAAARIVARGGPYAADICRACAEVCKQCAERCERFPDDKHMQECAKECRECQQACEDMLKHAAPHAGK